MVIFAGNAVKCSNIHCTDADLDFFFSPLWSANRGREWEIGKLPGLQLPDYLGVWHDGRKRFG